MKIPQIKKEIKAYLVGEDGKITKQSLLNLGTLIGSGLVATSMFSNPASAQFTHTNNLAVDYTSGDMVVGNHTHHASHASY